MQRPNALALRSETAGSCDDPHTRRLLCRPRLVRMFPRHGHQVLGEEHPAHLEQRHVGETVCAVVCSCPQQAGEDARAQDRGRLHAGLPESRRASHCCLCFLLKAVQQPCPGVFRGNRRCGELTLLELPGKNAAVRCLALAFNFSGMRQAGDHSRQHRPRRCRRSARFDQRSASTALRPGWRFDSVSNRTDPIRAILAGP